MTKLRVLFENGSPERVIEFDLSRAPFQHDGRPASLLDVLLGHGIHLEHACGGNCACTTCHVVVRAGAGNLSELEDAEADRLDTAWEVTPQSRLACQAVVRGDVECEIPVYSRNYVQEGGGIRLGKV